MVSYFQTLQIYEWFLKKVILISIDIIICIPIIMFHEERLPNISVRIIKQGRQDYAQLDVEINETGQINVNELIYTLREFGHISDNAHIFYFDHSYGTYVLVKMDSIVNVHFTSMLCENLIIVKVEERISDEILANPQNNYQDYRAKRSRERVIQDVFLLVQQWRYLYRQGSCNEKNQKIKINLDQSAQIIGVPRKTLEDYYLTLRNGMLNKFNFGKFKSQKIGVLRTFLRQRSKAKEDKKEKGEFNEQLFFYQLRKQIFDMEIEIQKKFFDLSSNKSNSSSDQYLIFQS